MDIKIPHLAEGIHSGSIVGILVSEGDTVAKGQTLLELETEKAVAPIPSPAAGKVEKILVKQGDLITVGQTVMILSAGSSKEPHLASEDIVPAGPMTDVPVSAASRQTKPRAGDSQGPENYQYHSSSGFPPPASPAVRKLAAELGIDLNRVRGSEKGGRITLEDVRDYVGYLQQSLQRGSLPDKGSVEALPKPVPEPVDFSKFGPVTRKPLSHLRKKIAEKMSASWGSVVLVTQFDQADISVLAALRKKYSKAYEKAGAHLTWTPLILKALVLTLQKHPEFNASLDEERGEVVYKEYYHLGLAVDTEQGLIVPVLRNADKKSILELAEEVAGLAEKTRTRKIGLEDLQGSTFTVSNQGGIGGAHFTPIVNAPETAILGLGQGRLKPVVRNGKVVSRLMLPLSLSYDHRLIDGGSAARFIRDLVGQLESFEEDTVALPAPEISKSKKGMMKSKKGKR